MPNILVVDDDAHIRELIRLYLTDEGFDVIEKPNGEAAMAVRLPVYAVIPLAFGTFCNPFIFLMEATLLYRSGMARGLYKGLKAASPTALFFAWFVLAFQFLPAYFLWALGAFTVLLMTAFFAHQMGAGKVGAEKKMPADTKV